MASNSDTNSTSGTEIAVIWNVFINARNADSSLNSCLMFSRPTNCGLLT